MSAAGSIIKVFISYCRQDEKLKQKLIDHLSLFKRQAIISISDSYSSEVSLEWTTTKYLDSSDLILLLISPAYMASDYCYDIEMVRAIERYEAGEAHVIPIILRPCYWQPAPFGKLLALPKHFKPITEWPNQEAAFTDIVKNIGRVLKDLQTFGYSRSTTPIPALTPISELSPYSSFTIYISFAWEDELMEREVESHLQMLQRQALITIWHSDMISPGNDWEQEINSHLHRAQIILLLVSRNYLTDEFHYDMEMRRAMERYEAGEARVIPIILSPCNWQPAPFGKLLALPKSGEPITTWDNSEAAFADVVKNVEIVIKELQGFGISGATTMTAIPLSKLSPDSPLSVYISFATADETMEREVESHLQMLQRQALITIWHPGMISAGRDWELEIHSHLQSAHIILLLVSQNYLTNEFLYRVEMARAMERYEAGEARVIPIILSPCDWQQAPFGKLLALPKVGKTVVEWTNREEVLAEIVKNIQIVSDELRTQHLLTAKALFTFDTVSQMSQDEKEEALNRIEKQLEANFESRIAVAAKKAVLESPESKRNTAISTLSLSGIFILLFEMTIYYWLSFRWLTQHTNSFGIQLSIDSLVILFIVGYMYPRIRKWCWGAGAFAVFITLLQIAGGPH